MTATPEVTTREQEIGCAPEPSSLPARVRAFDIATIVDRLGTIETWLAEGLTPRQAQLRAMQPPPRGFGQARITATRYVAAALHRMQQDTTQEPVESKRARSIAFWNAQIQRALSATRTYQQNGETHEYPCPDLKAANQARMALDVIEGVVDFGGRDR